jgi:hypothetical protein
MERTSTIVTSTDRSYRSYTCISTFTVPRGIDEFSSKSKSQKSSSKKSSSAATAVNKFGSTNGRTYSVATCNEFVVVGNEGGEIIVYNGRTGSQVALLSHSRMNSRAGDITHLDLSVDGSTILASTSSGLLFRWSCKPVWDGEILPDNDKA